MKCIKKVYKKWVIFHSSSNLYSGTNNVHGYEDIITDNFTKNKKINNLHSPHMDHFANNRFVKSAREA